MTYSMASLTGGIKENLFYSTLIRIVIKLLIFNRFIIKTKLIYQREKQIPVDLKQKLSKFVRYRKHILSNFECFHVAVVIN